VPYGAVFLWIYSLIRYTSREGKVVEYFALKQGVGCFSSVYPEEHGPHQNIGS
jgi:hypothetical protein